VIEMAAGDTTAWSTPPCQVGGNRREPGAVGGSTATDLLCRFSMLRSVTGAGAKGQALPLRRVGVMSADMTKGGALLPPATPLGIRATCDVMGGVSGCRTGDARNRAGASRSGAVAGG